MVTLLYKLPLILGWSADRVFGDPEKLPHPIVWYGKAISSLEHRFNNGANRETKGGLVALTLILGVYTISWFLLREISPWPMLDIAVQAILIFYCLAGTTLCREVRMVFKAADRSLEEGRRQVARIVGRDTTRLSDKEVRIAALETLAENLSDGVIAPLFWYILLGVPGMLAYKMVNTLDSMIGYKNERYREFGHVAARIDDVANYIPARLTAFLMLLGVGKLKLWSFVEKYGRAHASPNSGYPESALAAILNCRFGGPHDYFGERVDKPFIGDNDRDVNSQDMKTAIQVNRRAEIIMVVLALII